MAYIISPIDLIPDYIIGLGQIDDAAILGLSLYFMEKDLKKYKPQDWNELVVTVKGKVAHCTCNGEVLDAAMEVPASGPIGLEGDRGQMEYRRIRIKEL